ncbi:MAG: hypothetical protein ACRYFS_19840 [Janthinobacterium lividum]
MTFDEARLMANVNDRAQRLFADGYRARWVNGPVLAVRSPKNAVYRLDVGAETCDCLFFQRHLGRHTCKHILGYKTLLCRQRSMRRLVTLMLLKVWADLDDRPFAPEPKKPVDTQETEANYVAR